MLPYIQWIILAVISWLWIGVGVHLTDHKERNPKRIGWLLLGVGCFFSALSASHITQLIFFS